jgi:hypothetical protein
LDASLKKSMNINLYKNQFNKMQIILSNIPPQLWKKLFFPTVLMFTSCSWCCTNEKKAWAVNLDDQENLDLTVSNITYSDHTQTNEQFSHFLQENSQIQVETSIEDVRHSQQQEQSDDLPEESINTREQLFNQSHINPSKKIEIPLAKVEQQTQLPSESNVDQELNLRIRPKPLENIPLPPVKFKPIGYLKANVGYFQTSNIFSAENNPIQDGLVFSGLTLASAYIPVGSQTYLNASIDGNLIRYLDQSKYGYNQLRFNFGIYQQLSQKMYGELSWRNQQLFYSHNTEFFNAGERFLNEQSLQLSLGRRDAFSKKLFLDSVYGVSVNFSDPGSRSRIVNSLWVALNYSLQKPLQVGLNYQFNLSDFTERDRQDQFHSLYGNINYRISDKSSVSLQSGVNLGDSSVRNIDFSSWFFSVNYNFELGRF